MKSVLICDYLCVFVSLCMGRVGKGRVFKDFPQAMSGILMYCGMRQAYKEDRASFLLCWNPQRVFLDAGNDRGYKHDPRENNSVYQFQHCENIDLALTIRAYRKTYPPNRLYFFPVKQLSPVANQEKSAVERDEKPHCILGKQKFPVKLWKIQPKLPRVTEFARCKIGFFSLPDTVARNSLASTIKNNH